MKNIKINLSDLAERIGKKAETRTLPNGAVVSSINWLGTDLPRIAAELHHAGYGYEHIIEIDGAGPAWLAACIVHEVHPASCRLNSPDGYIPVGCQKPVPGGKGLEWDIRPLENGWTWVEFKLNPSVPLNPNELEKIAPPQLEMGAKVIISGRGPHWLTSSVVMAYHGRTKAVALFQPGIGATVCMTHSAEIKLGDVIKEEKK